MTINANKKFMDTILDRIASYKMVSHREITDLNELTDIMETATGCGYSLKVIKDIYCFIDASAEEYVYENGLNYLIIDINYKLPDGNIQTIKQHTLTSDYKDKPLVNIVVEKNRKATHQLLILSSSKDDIFPESMKDIEIEKTSVHVNDKCGSVFETYTNLNNNSVMLEKYMQYYPITHYDYSEKDLLNLCGCGSRYLEIIYCENEPIYAQLSKEYKVESANFDPNSAADAKIIVNTINDEVKAIVSKIESSIDDYERENTSVKKLENK